MTSHLPCYISSGLLALLLVIQQLQHNRITMALHNRILESKGLEPVPKVEVINKMIEAVMPERKPYNQEQERLIRQAQRKAGLRVHFEIPGMPTLKKAEDKK